MINPIEAIFRLLDKFPKPASDKPKKDKKSSTENSSSAPADTSDINGKGGNLDVTG